MKNRAQSWISSIPGFSLLAILCVVTAYYGMGWLPVFFFSLFLISLTSYIWGCFSLLKIRMEARGIRTRAFPGEKVSMSVEVSNGKILPLLWLEIRYFEQNPAFLDSNDDFTMNTTWLMGRQKASWNAEFNAVGRGVVLVDGMQASSGDAFGLRQTNMALVNGRPFTFVVYPSVYDVDVMPLIQSSSNFTPARKGCMEDNTIIAGIRDYAVGDSTRFIDWRVLAKQDVLAVDFHEKVTPYCICLALDFKSFSRWREEVTNAGVMTVPDSFNREGFEDMVSFAASCVRELTAKAIRCNLLLPSVLGRDK
ncbi:MAG: DUF58 domain-containing protein, partial [Spirochaetales bacterium]|nr:DUF58 domain-containing protein [Spirochaetales bacterium]